jgi:hypothetical protein
MFTPCSPLFRNVLYILLEGNEKGVAAAWMGFIHVKVINYPLFL